jgi:hypothetical protein
MKIEYFQVVFMKDFFQKSMKWKSILDKNFIEQQIFSVQNIYTLDENRKFLHDDGHKGFFEFCIPKKVTEIIINFLSLQNKIKKWKNYHKDIFPKLKKLII